MKNLFFLRWLLIVIFGVFLTRAVDLMLVRGAYYRNLADNNRVRIIDTPSARGRILTSTGEELAQNSVSYFNLAGEKITRQQALDLEARGGEVIKNWVREYPFGEMTAHLTGYIGEADKDEVEQASSMFGTYKGRGGLEEFYDHWLRGENGRRIIEVGVNEKVVRELGKKDPVPGSDLITSLDLDWQKSVWQAMEGKKGTAIILNPDNGEILAMASYPSFDPNLFTTNRNEKKIVEILNDDQFPILNRAIGGVYPPGSTFKIVTAAAGLEEGVIDADKKVEDTGVLRVGQWTYANWYWTSHGRTDGMVDLVKAIQRSNDIYFYKVGEWLGINSLVKWAEKFNFSKKTGVDLAGEVSGLFPDPKWKQQAKGESWFLGNTYHAAIGQGDLTATPLQVALETAVIANGGKLCSPHFGLNYTEGSDLGKNYCRSLDISKDHIQLIKQGMIAACRPGGTASIFFDFDGGELGCKTGTAEISKATKDTHAWFTLFYQPKSNTTEVLPSDSSDGVNPDQVVITVLLERGGGGATDAAPVAKEIIERYEGRYEEPAPTP